MARKRSIATSKIIRSPFPEAASTAIPEKRPITATDPECKLLGWPAELRNRIYTLALVNDDTFDITERHRANVDRLEPGLLATCREVRDEALSIFYGSNTFAGANGDSNLVHTFLKHLPAAKLKLLKQVRRTIIDNRVLWGGPEWPDEATQVIRRCARGYSVRYRQNIHVSCSFKRPFAACAAYRYNGDALGISRSLGRVFAGKEWKAWFAICAE